jgi:hypothetical protein
MPDRFLVFFARLIGYRFTSDLTRPLRLPTFYKKLPVHEIQEKARESAAVSGVFFAFSTAALIFAMDKYSRTFVSDLLDWRLSVASLALIVSLLYLVVRQERILSGPGRKISGYVVIVLLTASIFAFLIGPVRFQSGSSFITRMLSRDGLQSAFLPAGFLLTILSVLFQLFSIEYYDSASGWRGGAETEGLTLRFHLAGLASHCFLFGVSLALLGVSLLLSEINFWAASVVTVVVLVALVFMTEVERALWRMKTPRTRCRVCGKRRYWFDGEFWRCWKCVPPPLEDMTLVDLKEMVN